MPSVWHILVRVCCDAVFSSVFYRLGFTDSRLAAVSEGGFICFVPIGLLVCPPLYLMFILWVLGVKIRYVICLFVVMSAVTGRTHVIGVTALLRLGVIRRCGVRLGLQPRSLFRISLFALLTQICLFINNL